MDKQICFQKEKNLNFACFLIEKQPTKADLDIAYMGRIVYKQGQIGIQVHIYHKKRYIYHMTSAL